MRSLCRTRASARHDTRWPESPGEDDCHGQIPGLHQDVFGAAAARPVPRTLPQIASMQIRHRGNFSYVDATLTDDTSLKLCRLRYVGSASQWQFAIYRASHDDYDESVFFTGLPVGTCQDALDTACGLYLNDPTAWIRPPTNLRARPLCHPNLGSWPTRYVSSLGPQAGQSRDQLRRRAAQDSCPLAAGEFRTGLDVGATGNGEIAAQVGVVRAEHDPVDAHDVAQHVQHRVAPGQGRVPVQAAECLGRGRAALGSGDDAH